MKKSTNVRWHNDWIDFCWDGMYSKEKIKGFWKRYLGKWSRKKFIKNNEKDWNDK